MRSTYRVYYEDTDAGGIVYYANYLKFAERARTDALRELGFHQSHLRETQGLAFVVTRVEIDYHRPARLDDVITVQTLLRHVRKVRMSMQQRIYRETELLAELVVALAAIDATGRPVTIPEAIADALKTMKDQA